MATVSVKFLRSSKGVTAIIVCCIVLVLVISFVATYYSLRLVIRSQASTQSAYDQLNHFTISY